MNNRQKPSMLDDVVTALNQNTSTLEEIKIWMKINGIEKVRTILTKQLDSQEKILTYHLSDDRTTREIGTIVNIGIKTISTYWKSWYKLGLMKGEKVKGVGSRYFKIFYLEDYGIKIPPTIKKEQTTSLEEQNQTEFITEEEIKTGDESNDN